MIHGTKQDKILGQEFSVFLSKKLKKKFSFLTIQRIFGGASRETYRVVLKDEDQRTVNFIYRRYIWFLIILCVKFSLQMTRSNS